MTGAHLLLVDDSPEIAAVVHVLARRGGQALTVAPGLAAAWAALAAGPVGLVLLDLNLGGESGLELLRRRDKAGGGPPPVALFTQPELTEELAAGWALGADFVVSKGLIADPPQWQARVAEVVARGVGPGERRPLEWFRGTEQPPNQLAPSRWVGAFVRAAHHPIFRPFGIALLDEVLRRALNRLPAAQGGPIAGPLLSGRLEAALLSWGLSVADLWRLCADVVDQLWCLAGPGLSDAAEAVFAAELLPDLR